MAHVQHMAQLAAVHVLGQQREKGLEILCVELFGGHQLPDDGAEFFTQFAQAAVHKTRDRITRFAQHPAVGGKAVGLEREHKIIGCLVVPFLEARGLHGAVVGAVDLDRRELPACVGQFVFLRKAFWKKVVAPGLEGPAAYADPYSCFFAHLEFHGV